jgi:hypothetical protein
MSACVASAMHIEKRAGLLKCDTPTSCVSWYDTGSAGCYQGYTRYPLEVDRFTLGSYCEKPCDNSERIQCGAVNCIFFEGQCSLFPGNEICGKAISWCGTPIKTTEENCNERSMGQPVKYNATAHTCAADPDAEKDDQLLRFVLKTLPWSARLLLDCVPITNAGAQSIIAKMTKAANECKPEVNPENNTPNNFSWRCNEGKENFDKVKEVFKNACAIAEHPGNTAPTFKSEESAGAPPGTPGLPF